MKSVKKLIIFILVIALISAIFIWISNRPLENDIPVAENNAVDERIQIKYFYIIGCPVCDAMELFLDDLEIDFYGVINVRRYNILKYTKFLIELYQKHNVPHRKHGSVPITFFQERYFWGFSPKIGEDIRKYILELTINEMGAPVNGTKESK